VFEDGAQLRDFIHVRDVADCNVAALDGLASSPAGTTRAYNVASGTPHTVGEMACALAAAFGGLEPKVTGAYRLGDVRHIVASPQAAADELGFRARISFEEGMTEFATAPLRAPASSATS